LAAWLQNQIAKLESEENPRPPSSVAH